MGPRVRTPRGRGQAEGAPRCGYPLPRRRVHTASERNERALQARPPPLGLGERPRKPGRPAPRPPPPEPRPPSDGGAAPGNGALSAPRSGDRRAPAGRPRRLSQTPRRQPGQRPGAEPQHLRTDGAGSAAGSREPWGPGRGQRPRASGSRGSEERAGGAMTSVWKRLQRVGKRAAKFQFVACYHELVVECTKKW